MGFSKGFEKVSGIVSRVVGGGIKGAGKLMGAGSGALGALSVGSTVFDAQQNYKKNMQMARNAMQR